MPQWEASFTLYRSRIITRLGGGGSGSKGFFGRIGGGARRGTLSAVPEPSRSSFSCSMTRSMSSHTELFLIGRGTRVVAKL